MLNKIHHGDCLEVMKDIPDKSVDMILCDLPYGTTACKWDTIIPFEPLWEQYERVIKDNGAIVLTASQPFTSSLVMSNPRMFKYEWIWIKNRATGHLNAKIMPMKSHENIVVFCKKKTVYNPQKTKGKPYKKTPSTNTYKGYGNHQPVYQDNNGFRYPKTPLEFDSEQNEFHPTQKPVALFEYLIKTYTNEGETVLDNCIGSGTTAIASLNTGRYFIGIEKDEQYHKIACERVANWHDEQGLFKVTS